MPLLATISHIILLIHALGNICQGILTLFSPEHYRQMTGALFHGAPDKALQAIGLGAIGIGWYQLLFVAQRNRRLVLATIPLRVFLMSVMWTWGHRSAAMYDGAVVAVCAGALYG